MFGTFRYVLALLVLFQHTVPRLGGEPHGAGLYAVFSFFVLSGYVVTKVLHESYGVDGAATCRFLLNRGLRVYPLYWMTLAITALALIGVPDITVARGAQV